MNVILYFSGEPPPLIVKSDLILTKGPKPTPLKILRLCQKLGILIKKEYMIDH